jgi:hypothetical protein
MTCLESLASKFKEWRGDRRHYRYPKSFWDEVRELAKREPISAIAEACGITPHYLKNKILKEPRAVTFAQVQMTSLPSQAVIEFADGSSRPMTIRFQADHEQLVSMIRSLSVGS